MHFRSSLLPLALLPVAALASPHDDHHHDHLHDDPATVSVPILPSPGITDSTEDCASICKSYEDGTLKPCSAEWLKAVQACISAPCNRRFFQDPRAAAGCKADDEGVYTIQTDTRAGGSGDAGTTGSMTIVTDTTTVGVTVPTDDSGETGVMSILPTETDLDENVEITPTPGADEPTETPPGSGAAGLRWQIGWAAGVAGLLMFTVLA